MLSIEIDETKGIALLEPDCPLAKSDFEAAAKIVDPYLERVDKLNGLLIHTKSFPSWDSFAALSSHLKFVRDHHKKISRIAISTDSVVGGLAQTIAKHFISAEIKLFPYQELERAKQWAAGAESRGATHH